MKLSPNILPLWVEMALDADRFTALLYGWTNRYDVTIEEAIKFSDCRELYIIDPK